jgi:hypothetical protein
MLAEKLLEICAAYQGEGRLAVNNDYARGGAPFGNAVEELAEQLKKEFFES